MLQSVPIAFSSDSRLTSAPGGLSQMDYEDTEHYLVTCDFLMNRDRMLSILLDN